ncbi:hypothetical protein [Sphingomonas paucimobilis]|uniref:Mu-like prophage FluMu N-terminal domain-containing protein n=1 Tax=Sphingomonas paucimobilis TaxID=13689 RepID=A0A7T3E7T6_SPHPI|nr:hypothetical protein [Sphingomonas paucimobilis]QPT09711.1 hypothetical protein I6G38_05500 [Sphingomonas paucimobilis]
MAGVSDTPRGNRRPRVEAAGTRDTVASTLSTVTTAPLGDTPPPSDVLPVATEGATIATEAAALPDPTIVAEPGEPRPVVTASPPIAAEATVLDVLKGADAGASVLEPGAVETEKAAIAGQPMIAIDAGTDEAQRQSRLDSAAASITARDEPAWSGFDSARDTAPIVPRAKVTVVTVVGPVQGRRRAGFAFGPEPRHFLATQLTPEQAEAIAADPMLAVGVRELDEESDEVRAIRWGMR